MTELHTDEALLEALERLTSRSPSFELFDKQRISFVMGALPDNNSMTREEVQGVLERQKGRKVAAA